MLTPEQPPSELALVAGGEVIAPLLAITPEKIEEAAQRLMQAVLYGDLHEVQCPLDHCFTPGVYIRTIVMPAGSFIIGHEHKTRHANMVLRGSAYVMMEGKPFRLEAPFKFVSEPGVRKVLFIVEEMEFATIHANPDDETDLDKLAERLIVKRPSFVSYIEDVERLRHLLTKQP